MIEPLEICIEDLDAAAGAPKYVRCVALPGRQPGLRVGEKGELLWKGAGPTSCELWVSADARLILYRSAGAGVVAVKRAGRSLDAPHEKPVVLLDQDQVDAGGKRMRVHFHGVARVISPPTPVLTLARAAVAAVAGGAVLFGAAAAASGSEAGGRDAGVANAIRRNAGAPDAGVPEPIEVRVRPPEPMMPDPEPPSVEPPPVKLKKGR